MKILHTSDWHVGKRLITKERLLEQAEVLDEIAKICDDEQIELVLIAGDIFDTYTPSAEAEELFYAKVKAIAGENRAVLMISGNHDDGVRLSAITPLSGEQGVYVVGNSRELYVPQNNARSVRPIASGKGWVTFVNGDGEKVFIATLPYPNEARFKEEKSDLPYIERMKKWIDEGVSGNIENLPSILLAHIFVAGGSESAGEREIDLGGARAIPIDALPNCDYIALGHLHKKQKMGKAHVYYSGSPLQYAFDERADKSVKVFSLMKAGVENLKDVPLTKGKKLIRLQADSVENAELLLQGYPDSWVEMTLMLSAPMTAGDSARLAKKENLACLQTEIHTDTDLQFESRKGLTDAELFDAYYQTAYGTQPKAETKTLFLSVLSELDER